MELETKMENQIFFCPLCQKSNKFIESESPRGLFVCCSCQLRTKNPQKEDKLNIYQ